VYLHSLHTHSQLLLLIGSPRQANTSTLCISLGAFVLFYSLLVVVHYLTLSECVVHGGGGRRWRCLTGLSEIQEGAGVRVLSVLLWDGTSMLAHDELHPDSNGHNNNKPCSPHQDLRFLILFCFSSLPRVCPYRSTITASVTMVTIDNRLPCYPLHAGESN